MAAQLEPCAGRHRLIRYDREMAQGRVAADDFQAVVEQRETESVHRMADNPSNVLVIHHFDSVGAAKSFFSNPNLRDAMLSLAAKRQEPPPPTVAAAHRS